MSTVNITKEIFGQRLSSLMADYEVTQVGLAELLGIAQSAVSNYKQGKRLPPLEEAVKIARHFNVSLDYLLGWEEGANQASVVTQLAALFAERFGETKEEQQRFFDEYVLLIAKIRKSADELFRGLEDFELKTRFLAGKSASSKPASSKRPSATAGLLTEAERQHDQPSKSPH